MQSQLCRSKQSMAASSEQIFYPDKESILQQTFTQALQSNFNSVQKFTSWKEDHEKLKKNLKDLPDKLSHPAVIPFGTRALVKANIIHTNEILSCVGDGWFIKQSAKQAIDMCDRRIKESEKMLEDLEKERNLIRSRQIVPKEEDAFPNEDEQEIVEEYNEEEEAQWRVRHREMERKYHQELAELRKKREDEGPPQTEEDLFRRLDLLELEEELNDELERMNYDGDSDDEIEESGEDIDSEEDGEKQDTQEKDFTKQKVSPQIFSPSSSEQAQCDPLKRDKNLKENLEGFQKVPKNSPSLEPGQVTYGFTDKDGNHWQKSTLTNLPEEEISAPSTFQKSRKSVSFASDDGDSVLFASDDECSVTDKQQDMDPDIYIRFRHTNNKYQEPPADQTTEYGDIIAIKSPKDIYRQFGHLMAPSELRSILKKNSSYESESSTSGNVTPSCQPSGSSFGLRWQEEEEEEEDGDEPTRDLSHLPPVLRDVLEINEVPVSQPRSAESSRPVSRFKASRAAAKK